MTGVGSACESERAKFRFKSRHSFSLFFLLNNMKDWCILKDSRILIDILPFSLVLRILQAFEFLVSLEVIQYTNICYIILISFNLLHRRTRFLLHKF